MRMNSASEMSSDGQLPLDRSWVSMKYSSQSLLSFELSIVSDSDPQAGHAQVARHHSEHTLVVYTSSWPLNWCPHPTWRPARENSSSVRLMPRTPSSPSILLVRSWALLHAACASSRSRRP